MRGVVTHVDKDLDVALIEVTDPKVRAGLEEKLLESAGDNPREIRRLTGGNSVRYQVPLALAKKAGVIARAAPKSGQQKPADHDDE